jgi:hypothetical protein
MRKTSTILLVSMFLGAGAANAAAVLTADPLTKLPLIPATVGMLGNQPNSMDPTTICKSKMSANMYTVINSDFATTAAWYTAHLTGLKHSHVYSNGRSKEGYYSADGTALVIVLSRPGAEGAKLDTHSVDYYLFQPAVAEKTLLGILHDNVPC